jgi:hypothetical protein
MSERSSTAVRKAIWQTYQSEQYLRTVQHACSGFDYNRPIRTTLSSWSVHRFRSCATHKLFRHTQDRDISKRQAKVDNWIFVT